jgi:PKD repeat protein
MRAFSDQGCYTSITKPVALKATPNAKFTVANACDGNSVVINNQTAMTGGSSTINYVWSFGDASSSTVASPTHLYSSPGTYNIDLTATSTNGCYDTAHRSVNVYVVSVLSFNLASQYLLSAGAVQLIGSPAGGTFSGPGVSGSTFTAALAGAGTWSVTYTYTDAVTGCVRLLTKTVIVIESVVAEANQVAVITAPVDESDTAVVAVPVRFPVTLPVSVP